MRLNVPGIACFLLATGWAVALGFSPAVRNGFNITARGQVSSPSNTYKGPCGRHLPGGSVQ